MVSSARDDFPDPLGPQQTVICSRGSSTVTFLRLCCCAPSTRRCVISPLTSPERERRGVLAPRLRLGPVCNTDWSACPVYDSAHAATRSGVPAQTTSPPPLPPSGPRSITQSAVLITSRLCSITRTVLPASTNPCRT